MPRPYRLLAVLVPILAAACGRSLPQLPDAGLDLRDVPAAPPTGVGPDGGAIADADGGGAAGGPGAGVGGGGPVGGVSGGPSPVVPVCGNGLREPGEQCDLMDVGGATCEGRGFLGGPVRCTPQCALDFSSCRMRPEPPLQSCRRDLPTSGLPQACLRGLCECDPMAFSQCDEGCLSFMECMTFSCGGGGDIACTLAQCGHLIGSGDLPTVQALGACYRANFQACTGFPAPFCGDGFVDAFESCDRGDLLGQTCRSFGLGSGELRCREDCTLDTSDCRNDAFCGDGVVDPGEDCDSALPPGVTCVELGYRSGTPACTDCRYDVSQCHNCGDGWLEAGERCDGKNLGGLSCQRFGFTGGVLACDGECRHDTSGCARCGNGMSEPGESCDGADLGGASCAGLGLGAGTLACQAGCLFDVSGCDAAGVASCGNGLVESGEQCDGSNLLGLTCSAFGFDGGTLACNAATCRLDTSGCRFAGVLEPGQDCRSCSLERCGDVRASCETDPACISGLLCIAERCGPMADLECSFQCFGGRESAIRALGVFACVASQCGPSCAGF